MHFFFSSRRRHTRSKRDWSSDVCSSDLAASERQARPRGAAGRAETGRVDLIRPFQRQDIPRVLELFRAAFLNNGNHAPAGLESYFDRAIFQNPWYDEELPSFVHAQSDGSIAGFVGVQPKRLK